MKKDLSHVKPNKPISSPKECRSDAARAKNIAQQLLGEINAGGIRESDASEGFVSGRRGDLSSEQLPFGGAGEKDPVFDPHQLSKVSIIDT